MSKYTVLLYRRPTIAREHECPVCGSDITGYQEDEIMYPNNYPGWDYMWRSASFKLVPIKASWPGEAAYKAKQKLHDLEYKEWEKEHDPYTEEFDEKFYYMTIWVTKGWGKYLDFGDE